MPQSDAFMASTSLTPSPVMATVWPWAFSVSMSFFFLSGVTRPNTVHSAAAFRKSSSVSSCPASM